MREGRKGVHSLKFLQDAAVAEESEDDSDASEVSLADVVQAALAEASSSGEDGGKAEPAAGPPSAVQAHGHEVAASAAISAASGTAAAAVTASAPSAAVVASDIAAPGPGLQTEGAASGAALPRVGAISDYDGFMAASCYSSELAAGRFGIFKITRKGNSLQAACPFHKKSDHRLQEDSILPVRRLQRMQCDLRPAVHLVQFGAGAY